MKKCTFYRVMNQNGLKAVKTQGFCETVTDKNGHEFTLCFNKLYYNLWIVTEQSTGFRVCEGGTRMEAFENSKYYIDKIYDKVINLEKYIDIIAKAYEKDSKKKAG